MNNLIFFLGDNSFDLWFLPLTMVFSLLITSFLRNIDKNMTSVDFFKFTFSLFVGFSLVIKITLDHYSPEIKSANYSISYNFMNNTIHITKTNLLSRSDTINLDGTPEHVETYNYYQINCEENGKKVKAADCWNKAKNQSIDSLIKSIESTHQ